MKKVLCLFVAILIVGGMFTACGGNEIGDASGNTTEGKAEKENTVAVESEAPAETYLVDKVINLSTVTTLHRNEEGLITSFEREHKKEYLCDYDDNGNILKISKFGYSDGSGARIYYETPDEVWNFTYDAEGKLVTYVHEGSDPWTYRYDENGRLSTIALYGDVEVRYSYDAQGRITAKQVQNVVNLDEEYLFEYDSEGKLTKYHEIEYSHGEAYYEFVCSYSYDSGVVTSIARKTISRGYENEQNVVCKYDDNGLMIEQEVDGMMKMYEIKYVPMTLTAEQAERAAENTEYILAFTNHLIMPNEYYVEDLK